MDAAAKALFPQLKLYDASREEIEADPAQYPGPSWHDLSPAQNKVILNLAKYIIWKRTGEEKWKTEAQIAEIPRQILESVA